MSKLIACGLSNKEISSLLDITYGGVKETVWRVFKKLGIENRTELALRIREFSLLFLLLLFPMAAKAQVDGIRLLGVDPYPSHVRVFAGTYDCSFMADQTPAIVVNVDCLDNNGIHTTSTLTVSSTPQTFNIETPPFQVCDSNSIQPCAAADRVTFTIQSGNWTISASLVESGVTMHAKGTL